MIIQCSVSALDKLLEPVDLPLQTWLPGRIVVLKKSTCHMRPEERKKKLSGEKGKGKSKGGASGGGVGGRTEKMDQK